MELFSSFIRHLSSERERLPLWLPVMLGTGIGIYYGWPVEPSAWYGVGVIVFGAAVAWLGRKNLAVRLLAVMGVVMALGFTAASLRTQSVASPVLYSQLFFREVQGRIDDIQLKEKGQKLVLSQVEIEDVKPETTPKKISVSLKKPQAELMVGDRVMVKAMLFPPPAPNIPGGYDFARSFYYDQLGGVGYSPQAAVVLEHSGVSGFEAWLNKLRLELNDRIVSPMGEENGPVAAAMMVGEMSNVSQEVSDAMRGAGIYHVLSISGLHMTLAVALVYVTIRFLLSLYPPLAMRLPTKKIAATIGLISAFAYLLLAGYPVPAVRSFVMVACVMLAILFDRRGISLYSLAWAAFVILLLEPEAVLGVSFQLSFAATLGIIAFYESYRDRLHKPGGGMWHKIGLYFGGLLLTSLIATLATTPLTIYNFNRFTLWGIAANMLIIPLASFWIMPAAVVAFVMMPFGWERLPLLVLDKGIEWMIAGSKWVASLPLASIPMVSPTFIGMLMVAYGGLWLCIWRTRWRLFGIPVAVIGFLTLLLHEPYDVLVSDDATKVAVRLPNGQYAFLRGKPTGFDAGVWLRANGQETGLSRKEMQSLTGAPVCDKNKCMVEMGGEKIAVALRKQVAGLCENATMVISQSYHDESACDALRLKIDRAYLREHGGVGIRFKKEGMQVEDVATGRGQRPWNSYRAHSRLYDDTDWVITDE